MVDEAYTSHSQIVFIKLIQYINNYYYDNI
jgi:hypothetical protein